METVNRTTAATEEHRFTFFRCQDTSKNKTKAEDVSFGNPLRIAADQTKGASKGSPRFGSLSCNSFFSRHNPHPNRVTHIQGLNGTPVCMVNDECYATTPLAPHPFIKNLVPRTHPGAPALHMPYGYCYEDNGMSLRAALLSETWREELKDLAAKVSMSALAKKEKKSAEDEPVRRMSQYSAQTGRIIPPSSQALSRRSTRGSLRYSRTTGHVHSSALYDQELMVLELLCQILQTDSLSQVQQWLLLADQNEKQLAMGLIQQAVDGGPFHQQRDGEASPQERPAAHSPLPAGVSSTGRLGSKHRHFGSRKGKQPIKAEDKPERIGSAEVLQVHSEETPYVEKNTISDN